MEGEFKSKKVGAKIEGEWVSVRCGKSLELPSDLKITGMNVWKNELVVCTEQGVYLLQKKNWWEFWK